MALPPIDRRTADSYLSKLNQIFETFSALKNRVKNQYLPVLGLEATVTKSRLLSVCLSAPDNLAVNPTQAPTAHSEAK